MLGPRDRVARNEMDARRHDRAEVAHRRALDRADIGQDRALLQGGRDAAAQFDIGRMGRRDHHEIGARRGHGGVERRFVGQAQSARRVERCLRARAGDDHARAFVAAQDVRQGRTDEPDTDERDAREMQIVHDTPKKSLTVAVTARISSSRPIVMRRCSGRP